MTLVELLYAGLQSPGNGKQNVTPSGYINSIPIGHKSFKSCLPTIKSWRSSSDWNEKCLLFIKTYLMQRNYTLVFIIHHLRDEHHQPFSPRSRVVYFHWFIRSGFLGGHGYITLSEISFTKFVLPMQTVLQPEIFLDFLSWPSKQEVMV